MTDTIGPSDPPNEIALQDLVAVFGTVQLDLGGADDDDLVPAGPALDGPADGHEGNLVIGTAVAVLREFGGPRLSRTQARALLPMWRHFPDVAPADLVAILRRFPDGGGR